MFQESPKPEIDHHQLIGVCWVLTTRCTHKCPKCFALEGLPDGELGEQKRMIDIMADSGVVKLTFAGGDPVLVEHLTELIKYAHDKGMDTALFATGSGLDDDKIEALNTGILTHLSLPLEGSTPEIHKLVMGDKDHHKTIIDLLPKVVGKEFNLEISTVVTSKNLDDLENLGKLLSKFKVPKWKLFHFYPLGRGLINRKQFEITEEEFLNKSAEIVNRFQNIDIDIQVGDPGKQASYFNLGPRGDVFTAIGEEYVFMGNIFDTSPKEIWRDPRFNHERHASRHWRDLK